MPMPGSPPSTSPNSRIVKLLATSLALLAPDHPARPPLQEAYDTAFGLDPYLEHCSTPLIVPAGHSVPAKEVREVWEDLLATTQLTDWAGLHRDGKTKWALGSGMCSGDYEAKVLQCFALDCQATSVLEIGMFTGTTSLALALLPRITRVVALDIEPFLETFDRPYWERAGVSHKIQSRIGPAADALRTLKSEGEGPFSLAFIDADKPSYKEYVELLLELDLIAPDGIIIADNTAYKGLWTPSNSLVTPTSHIKSNNQSHSVATEGIKTFNEFVRHHPGLEVIMIPVRDGISVIRRKI